MLALEMISVDESSLSTTSIRAPFFNQTHPFQ